MLRRWLCRLVGHGNSERWYEPWRREPVTGMYLDRQVSDICVRCGIILESCTERATFGEGH